MKVSPIRYILTVLAVFIGIFATDFLIHQVLLASDYGATKEVWREPESIGKLMGIMMLGQFLVAFAVCYIYARGFFGISMRDTLIFGMVLGLIGGGTSLIFYCVLPITSSLASKWFLYGTIQMVLLVLIARFTLGRAKP